jgi:acyl-coenzyme A thioesterase PaaI-like protein
MLMTFADMQLGLGARFHAEEDFGFMPTVNLTADFLAPAPLGAWVEGRTDLLRSTRNFLFCQCIVTLERRAGNACERHHESRRRTGNIDQGTAKSA